MTASIDTTAAHNPANSSETGSKGTRRAGLILIPLFIVLVFGMASAGMGRQAEVAAAKAKPSFAQTADPATVKAVLDSLPEDVSEEKREELREAAEKVLGDAPEPEAQQQGSPLQGLLGLFLLFSLIVIVMGIWQLLSARAPKAVRVISTIALPLMMLTGLGTIGLAWVALQEEPEEKRRPFNTLAVMGDYARQDDVRLSVVTQGESQPRVEIDLVPEVGGKVVYVSPNFIDGGIFRRGETLVRIDPSDFEVAVISAQANLANAQQALAREIAEGELALRDLEDFGVSDPSSLARRQPQRQQAEAAVRAAEAELERANLQLGRTSVRAPFPGRVRSKNADLGQFVSPGARLGRIFSTDTIEVRLPLTDADLAKIDLPIAFIADSWETAPRVQLSTTLAGERREWEARIMRTDASYDTQTRALFAIAELRDPFGAGAVDGVPLAPGLFVDAVIEGRSLEGVVVLPRDGLRPRNEVYVVDNEGKAEIRQATVIDTSPERAVIRTGVRPGELVVVSPMERSRIETPLKVLDINSPTTVLVDPPKPAWMRERDGEGGESAAPRSREREGGNTADRGSADRDSDDTDTAATTSETTSTDGD